MKIIKPLLTLIGAFTVAGMLAATVLFYFAPALLQEEDTLQKADAIVVLGGDYFRPIHAADLYLQGYAPKLLVSKPVTSPKKAAARELGIPVPYQWEVYKEILLKKGIPPQSFEFFGRDNVSTIEEAEELKKRLGQETKSIILVTSPLHTRRAGIIFREILPERTKVIVKATPDESTPEQWWNNFRTAPFVLLEVAKTIYYELGGGFRSTQQLQTK